MPAELLTINTRGPGNALRIDSKCFYISQKLLSCYAFVTDPKVDSRRGGTGKGSWG